MTGPILLTAWLSSPLAGDPPQLDALLEWSLSPFEDDFRRGQEAGLTHHKVDRSLPAPPQGKIAIPIRREWLDKHLVACCSNPILPKPQTETVEYVCKRISTENAELLATQERKVVSTTNSWTKSYRLPLRIRQVMCVRWFCMGNERNLKKALRDVKAIGKKVSDGYGRVKEWVTEPAREDCSWYAPSPSGLVLMRTLPVGDWLPKDLLGCRRHFGACCPPYWHPERFTEVVEPC